MPNYWAVFNLKQSDDYTGDIVAFTDQSATIYVSLSTVDGKLISQFIPHLLPQSQSASTGQRRQHDAFYHTVEYKKNHYLIYASHLILLSGIESIPASALLKMARLSSDAIDQSRILFGFNEITVAVPSIGAILFDEILNPFYCFQFFSVILWFIDEYVTYAASIVIMTAGSMATTLYQVRKERRHLRDMVEKNNTTKVTCYRESQWIELLS